LSLLEVEKLTSGYSKLPIVQEVSLHSEGATITCILGPNGSGKSTLLKTIAGVLKPMSGAVTFDGERISGWSPHKIARRGLAYVPQLGNVFPSLSVVENLEMGGFARKGKDLSDRIGTVLDTFSDLALARRKRARELSVGQRNLLAIARGLMLGPKLLLVDEPTAGLAPANRSLIWSSFERIAADGVGILVVEQDVDSTLEHSSWAYILTNGRNRLDGSSEDVRRTSLDAVFLGLSSATSDDSRDATMENGRSPGMSRIEGGKQW
jgi:branched-chain amino acid transport system ATP-binding protein